jgi:CxxC motif-containing protein (DUF1111 family)
LRSTAKAWTWSPIYSRNLGVPERRNPADPTVLRGKALFHDLNCQGCHQPKHVTHRLDGQPEQSFQLIWPYTDLLLHDMGPGLADNRPEGRAGGSRMEDRAALGHRADRRWFPATRNSCTTAARAALLEAILWHGGEAQAAARRRRGAVGPRTAPP